MANTPIALSTLSFLATGMWLCESFPVLISLGSLEDTPEMGQHQGGRQGCSERLWSWEEARGIFSRKEILKR